MTWDWATFFYILASIYLIVNLVLWIGLVVAIWIIYRKIKTKISLIETAIKAKVSLTNLSWQTTKLSLPLIVTQIVRHFISSRQKRN